MSLAQAFGEALGNKITPSNFLHYAYKHQMRLINFPPDLPYPKSQRGWTAKQHYKLILPRVAALQREFAEQTGEADPDDPHEDIKDESYSFEPWTEGKLIFLRDVLYN